MEKLDRIVVYASLGLRPGISELLWAFRKKHTLEEFPVYLDDHPFQIHERIRLEQKNGMRTADVVLLPHYMTMRLKSEGMLIGHDPAGIESYPQGLYDRERNWFAAGITFMAMAYNPRYLRMEDLPEGMEELSSPKWENKLGMQSLTSSKAGNIGAHYMAYLKKRVGSKKWLDLLRSLADSNRPKTYDCIDHLVQGLIDGNHQLALTVYSLAYLRERAAGSPIKHFEREELPSMLTFASMGLLRSAEENASARRFMDFLLSEEAQRIIANISGIFPVRPHVDADGGGDIVELVSEPHKEFYPDEGDLESMNEAMETFRRLNVP